jgi:hypothetical protein
VLSSFGRNQTDDSTATLEQTKPDLLWLAENVLVVKGEEKAPSNKLGNAQAQLVQNDGHYDTRIYGQIPYIFSYAQALNTFELYTIDVQANPGQQRQQLAFTFDLSRPCDRFKICLAFINIARIIDHYKQSNLLRWTFPFRFSMWVLRSMNEGKYSVQLKFDSEKEIVSKKIKYPKKQQDNYPYSNVEELKDLYQLTKDVII